MKYCRGGVMALIAGTSLALAACSSDNGGGSGPDASTGGSSGSSGSGSGGRSTGGASSGGKSSGGASSGGTSSGGTSSGGSSGGGAGGKTSTPDGGIPDGGGDATTPDGGDAGSNQKLIARGDYLVNAVALCGGCHTDRAKPTAVLAGNATFRTGLPAPNLTSDDSGLGTWSDAQIKKAFMDGIDDQGKALNPTMPYQLFHNLSDADANAIVAYLRSLPHVANTVGERTTDVPTAATPFALSDFPDTKLVEADSGADFAAAEVGRYLLTSAAQCVRCHSPVAAGAPDLGVGKTFTGGAPNPTGTPANQFAPNITPDATGIAGWKPADVLTLLKMGTDKAGKAICGPMAVGPTGGYGKLTDDDAHAIGLYLTTIPAVANAAADPSKEPACP